MVAGIGLGDLRIESLCLPVELAGLNDDTAEGCSVSADELGSGMNNDVCSVLDRSDEIRSSEGVIYNNRKSVLMCYL